MEPLDLFVIAALAMILVYALGSVVRLWDCVDSNLKCNGLHKAAGIVRRDLSIWISRCPYSRKGFVLFEEISPLPHQERLLAGVALHS
jgi:hypothetical protein